MDYPDATRQEPASQVPDTLLDPLSLCLFVPFSCPTLCERGHHENSEKCDYLHK